MQLQNFVVCLLVVGINLILITTWEATKEEIEGMKEMKARLKRRGRRTKKERGKEEQAWEV